MKRIASLVAVLALAALAAGAQVFPALPGANSLESTVTQGLMLNAIDSSFSVQNDFGSVATPFLFAGLSGNPQELLNDSGTSSLFTAGYYQPGKLPFSALLSMTGTSNGPMANAYIDATYSAANVKTSEASYTFHQPSALGTLVLNASGFLQISGITTGLVVSSNENWNDTAGDSAYYRNATTTYYSGTSNDYTTTANTTNVNSGALPAAGQNGANTVTATNTFYIPFALKTGDIQHFGYARLKLYHSDSSAAYSNSESLHQVTAGLANTSEETLSIDSSISQTTISLLYGASLPGFIMKDKGAKFSAGVCVSDAITSQAYDYDDTTRLYNLLTVGSKTAIAGGTRTVESQSYDAANYIGFNVYADHSLPYAPAAGMQFIVKPRVSALVSFDRDGSYASSANGGIATGTVTYSQPLDANGNYDNTAYTKTTTTISGNAPLVTTVGFGFTLPMGFEWKPEKLPFGFYAGSTAKMSFAWATTKNYERTTTQVVSTYTGAANVDVTTYTVSNASSSTTLTPDFSEKHSLGLFVPFADNIRLDISLNGANLLDFDSFTCQVVIPLK